ncbi:response regulator transcription factor [Streptomyces sp. FIT100]|uniref:response regulator transcription factor n=1 Tax=Streptomyces sp. FIT100 TaxID=2837956 RepID=UPI0021C68DD7|nr:response regulator transcription factor [Streptomyces sp. FIT100]UUN27568.1 response regulator transcription factor [Streptomyces sp. FIT100]
MRLLIVEDEKRLAQSLAAGLTAEGYDVDVVHDGLDGLGKAAAGGYDLIVLDVMLPGMDGFRVCRTLRGAGDDVPILMLTAMDGEYDEAEGLDTGADDYLTKPFSYVVLNARIKALLRRHGRTEPPSVLTVGGLTVDTAARRVHRDGTEVVLTAREFAVLEDLAQQPGTALSKRDILDHIWDSAYDGDPNIVEVYISALRRKLGAAYIQTVRGTGYRLVEPRREP